VLLRSIELSLPLDASSKLDRSPALIEKLMDHGEEQATHFLETVHTQSALEKAWEAKNVEAVMAVFTENAEIRFLPPIDSSAHEVRYRGKQEIQDLVKRGLRKNLSLEQSRDHRLVGEKMICWMLVTADHLRTPVKGRAETVVREDRIEAFTFRPLNKSYMVYHEVQHLKDE
jgi:hypothetical protein